MAKRPKPHPLAQIESAIAACERCADLRAYCTEVGQTKRKAYLDWDYWARPVPGFGDHHARLLIVGLAPAAHGANRTGRMFTGDRSGDFLFAALHRVGLASQPNADSRDDGLTLTGVYIGATIRCAPPANKPTTAQINACRSYLVDEITVIDPNVILCLGTIGWNAALAALKELDEPVPRPRPKFGHGATCTIGHRTMIGSYHVSQQNTFTGRLTPDMLDAVLNKAIDKGHAS